MFNRFIDNQACAVPTLAKRNKLNGIIETERLHRRSRWRCNFYARANRMHRLRLTQSATGKNFRQNFCMCCWQTVAARHWTRSTVAYVDIVRYIREREGERERPRVHARFYVFRRWLAASQRTTPTLFDLENFRG